LKSALQGGLKSALGDAGKFTAIWQSEPNGTDWPLFTWLSNLFEPYVSEVIFDGRHQVVKDNAILFDAWVYARDPAYYQQFRGKNAFLVHPFDEFLDLGVDRYTNFRGVFRMIWSSVFNPKHVMVFPLGSYLEAPPASIVPASQRRYAWSFVGEAGKVSRPDMVRAMTPIEPHICFSETPVRGITFFNRDSSGKKRIPKQDFYQIMGQSAFAPSPQGNATIESCRPYDALEVGAIPIVERRLTLDYYKSLLGKHPLPTVDSWSQGRQLAVNLLADPARLDELQQTCLQWWKQYKCKLIERIGIFLTERSNTEDVLVPLRSNLPNWPLWQYVELLRHHNLPGLGRRVAQQAQRIVQQRKWRLAITKPGDV
jgi:hypothetical protein